MQQKQPYIKIQEFSFWEFCAALEKAVADGYRLDFETNAGFPSAYISSYSAGLKLEVEPEESAEEQTESIKRRGRPPKILA